ncbi:MAG: aminopeptidase P family protein [Deltaproteobacteria bacterium]|nr:aminopeptidase P family protein [Deltaproteobacteria bacterium]
MLSPAVFSRRRQALTAQVEGPILLMGNGLRPRNLAMAPLPFRQDSNTLYLTGCDLPDAAFLLHEGRCTLFLPAPGEDDDLWHGHRTSLDAIGERLGVDAVRPAEELARHLASLGRVRTLAVPDRGRNALASQLTGTALDFGVAHGDMDLVRALIALRRTKGPEEIAEMRAAGAVTRDAHLAVMRATRPGVSELALATLFDAVLAVRRATPGYGTILSQAGEVLHNPHHDGILEAGRLLLVDGGAEIGSGYGADVTRAFPVSGRFNPRQRDAYQAVLEAAEAGIARCRAGVRYREVHDAASRVIARFLADEGLITVSPEVAVEAGAHALFFPHGVGHLIGLDVHDLENYGDLPAYPADRGRSEQFGTAYLRLDLPLEAGWVVTVEPGFYAVPAILHRPALRERFAGMVDFDRAEGWIGFGGIRIEDDVHVTASAPEVLTPGIPRTVEEVEAVLGTAPELLAWAE